MSSDSKGDVSENDYRVVIVFKLNLRRLKDFFKANRIPLPRGALSARKLFNKLNSLRKRGDERVESLTDLNMSEPGLFYDIETKGPSYYHSEKAKNVQERKSRLEDIVRPDNLFRDEIQISDPNDLFLIQPGDHFSFFKFHVRFYDLERSGHERFREHLSQINIGLTCRSLINQKYFQDHIKKSRFVILVQHDSNQDEEFGVEALIMAEPHLKRGMYIPLICANQIFSAKKKYAQWAKIQQDSKKILTTSEMSRLCESLNVGEIKLSLGVYLHYVLIKHCIKTGFTNVYLDASREDLIGYYQRWGYLLGRNPCKELDMVRNTHEKWILNNKKATEEDLPSGFKTNRGFMMKLCEKRHSIFLVKMEQYAKAKIDQAWDDLMTYNDINLDED